MQQALETKTCTRCKTPKPTSAFYQRPKWQGPGLRAECKACNRRIFHATASPAEKHCARCGVTKPSSDFYRDKKTKDGLYAYCRTCYNHFKRISDHRRWDEIKAYHKRWRRDNPEKALSYELKSLFGLSLGEYRDLLAKQGGVCAICKSPEFRKKNGKVMRLAIDHCHTTGKVRGLLCGGCNPGLGHFLDNPDLLWAAADYLKSARDG